MIPPSQFAAMTGRELLLLLGIDTHKAVLVDVGEVEFWVWYRGGLVHVADRIFGLGASLHRAGNLRCTVGGFMPCTDVSTERQRLEAAGYMVGIEEGRLIVRRGKIILHGEDLELPSAEHYARVHKRRAIQRGWAIARRDYDQ